VTDTTSDDATGEVLIDHDRLAAWMDGAGVPGAGEPLETRLITGGSQNETFEIRRGGLHCALRRPPRNPPPGRDEGIVREWRIIAALDGTDVPHTEAIAVCDDPSVLGGAFYLMGFVDGWSPVGADAFPPPFDDDPEARRGMALQLVDGIAKLSRVDWRARGLEGLGRPDGFHDRQVERWLRFLDRVRSRELPGLDDATDWLRTHRPLDYVPGIMHGDYQFANVMFGYELPTRLAAIVDWEMGTVGDPKLDLGWVVQSWPDDTGEATQGYTNLAGMPGRDELIDHYARESGRQVDDIDYYVILARWKLAIVLEQGYRRYVDGAGDNEKLAMFGPVVLDLMRRAGELARSTPYSS
jgi:aminoglycoside phosphotransferase (APT) family kinase protein